MDELSEPGKPVSEQSPNPYELADEYRAYRATHHLEPNEAQARMLKRQINDANAACGLAYAPWMEVPGGLASPQR